MNENESFSPELEQMRIAYENALMHGKFQAGFLARTAHEIRAPLGSLMGLHQLIIHDLCETPEEEKEFIQDAYNYAKKLMTLMDQLIEVSKLEGGKIEVELTSFNAYQFLLSVQKIMRLQGANRNVNLTVKCDNTDILIFADHRKLIQSFCYLLELAIDLAELGTIEMRAELAHDNPKCLINICLPFNSAKINEPITLGAVSFEENSDVEQLPKLSVGTKINLAHRMIGLMGGELKIRKTTAKATWLEVSLPIPETL